MDKRDLADALLEEEGLVTPGRTDFSFSVSFGKLAKNEKLFTVFVNDLAETFRMVQTQNNRELGLMFAMPNNKALAVAVPKELGIDDYAVWNDRHDIINCKPNTDYVFVGYCIAKGEGIHDAEKSLRDLNTGAHVKYGLFLFDRQLWDKNLEGLDIEIYSTLTWKDLILASFFPAKKSKPLIYSQL